MLFTASSIHGQLPSSAHIGEAAQGHPCLLIFIAQSLYFESWMMDWRLNHKDLSAYIDCGVDVITDSSGLAATGTGLWQLEGQV